ncbi:Glycogen synthase [compost metagenome]
MRIALTVDPEIAVPPIHYGGIERIVDFLVTEYNKLGHEVYLYANGDSRKDCNLKIWPGKSSTKKLDTIKNTLFLSKGFIKYKFDIVHSFSRLAYLALILPLGAKCIMSYQREPTLSQIIQANKLAFKKNLIFTGCSDYITNQIKSYVEAFTIYNGVDIKLFNLNNQVDTNAPLVFLGRIEPIKGTHNAIKLARAVNKNLIIAGNIPTEYQYYFEKEIKPQLDNKITYIGPVNDKEKTILLKNALALLMLIEWNEPFGIVMAEAMACGTPVLGTPRGAVNEVVINGENGYLGEDISTWIERIEKIDQIDRSKVRIDAERRFSSEVISNKYLQLYTSLIKRR